jgi:hypothetical protein
LHSATFAAAKLITTLPTRNSLIAIGHSQSPTRNAQTPAFACCGFHQSAADNLTAMSEATNLLIVDLLHFMGDRRQQPTYSQLSSFWHSDCL